MRYFSVLVCAFLCANVLAQTPAPQAAPAAPSAIPLDAFTKFDQFGGVKISPDGQYYAVLTGKYGRSAIVFVEIKTQRAVGGVRAQNDCEIFEYHWISPTRLIYTEAQRQRGRVRPTPTGEIFAVNRDGSGIRLLYGYRAEESTMDTHIARRKASYASASYLGALKKDPNHVLIAEYPWRILQNVAYDDPDAKPLISRLDVYSGDKKQLDMAPLHGASLLLDHNDDVRFAFGRDERQKYTVSWKPQADGEWTSFELDGFREESVFPLRFSIDNRSVYLTAVPDGEKYDVLYRLDLQTHQLEKVHAFPDMDVADVITDFADREVVGVTGYGDRGSEFWLAKDSATAQTYQALGRAFPNQRVTVTSASDDGLRVVLFVDSDVNPGDYYLFDTATKHADFLRSGRQWIEPKQMRPKEPITLKARDGLELHGYVTRPTGDGPHPMVVLPHGGPHGIRDDWEYDPEVQLLASRGYAALQVNYRGSGGYGIDFQRAGYREWGLKMQDDLTDATRWAIEQKITTADSICIYGASYGGFAALMGVAREPDLYRCAIGYAGVYDLPLMWEAGDTRESEFGRTFLERVIGSDEAKLRAQSPVYNAQNIKVPVLLIHGKVDGRADYEHAKRMRAALEQNHKKVEWLALSGEGHGVYDEDSRREVYERILQFLDANLMKATTAAQ
ncbi:MAG TPA: S9 family peptidase [Steroidobacteraceae bacterium]|jgi:dipeptidyl aminopeptidase/acylaminoacyl peptidase